MKRTGHSALVLKLGGKCNLRCAHCHALQNEYPFNPDIMEFMKQGNFTRVTFSGGEPFLYFKRMKAVMEHLGPGVRYRSPTNGTVLTAEMMDFCNGYDFDLFLSYDGRGSGPGSEPGFGPGFGPGSGQDAGPGSGCGRDTRIPVRYHVLNRFKGCVGISTLAGPGCDYRRLAVDVGVVIRKRLDRIDVVPPNSLHFNFPHQTENTRIPVTEDDVNRHIGYLCERLDSDLFELTRGNHPLRQLNELCRYVKRYAGTNRITYGTACCNNIVLNMNLSGEFTVCPYSHKVVGDIYKGVDERLVNKSLPEKCGQCELFPYCRNTCAENVTDNECRIFRRSFPRFLELCALYGMDPERLAASLADSPGA